MLTWIFSEFCIVKYRQRDEKKIMTTKRSSRVREKKKKKIKIA